jgi:hypothetical protein
MFEELNLIEKILWGIAIFLVIIIFINGIIVLFIKFIL